MVDISIKVFYFEKPNFTCEVTLGKCDPFEMEMKATSLFNFAIGGAKLIMSKKVQGEFAVIMHMGNNAQIIGDLVKKKRILWEN